MAYDKNELYDEYDKINSLIIDEIENLKYLLDNTLISNINLLNIHYTIYDLILKRNNIKDMIYYEYNEIITDEI